MRNPRNLFILVGLLAQTLTWDTYALSGIVAMAWLFVVTRRQQSQLTLTVEGLALLLGCVASLSVSKLLGRSAHFFIGDGLLALQLVRLIRPLNRREKLTSIVVACFHLGVLCTLAPNLRFLVLFTAGLYLLPGSLKEAFHDREATAYTSRSGLAPEVQFVPTMRVCLWMILGSVFVFLTFPRFTGSPLQFREGFSDQGSLLDNILDPRKGGRANSQQVLLQIEGLEVGYLRCFALTEFDGIQWSAATTAPLRPNVWTNTTELTHNKRFYSRKVYVKNPPYLGKIIPVDGRPVYMWQTFFTPPGRNVVNDAWECPSMWTTRNNTYEYYVSARPQPEFLLPELADRLRFVPPQSERLKSWLVEVTSRGTNALHKARILERHLRDNFRYQIGTPELNRLTPTDDFIFNRKEGHCERFAASMALFLRMQGIPSRVAIGYVPTGRNMFSGRLQVRFRDAHSWTEGYFPGVGWTTFDATPGPPPGAQGSDFFDMMEELEFAWYSHVVNFNGFAQRDLAAAGIQLLGKVPSGAWSWLCAGFVLLLFGCVVTKAQLKMPFNFRLPALQRRLTPQAVARHYYDEMLHLWQKRGIEKEQAQTPIEFLENLRKKTQFGYSEARVVTEHFCQSFYGGKALTPDQQDKTQAALKRLKHDGAAYDKNLHQPERV